MKQLLLGEEFLSPAFKSGIHLQAWMLNYMLMDATCLQDHYSFVVNKSKSKNCFGDLRSLKSTHNSAPARSIFTSDSFVLFQGIRDSQIHIRPPHLMHITGSIRQWRHRPEVLIKGCCNYTAHVKKYFINTLYFFFRNSQS